MAFKSLEDIYANQCAGKPVVPLQRHMLTEKYFITLKDENSVAVNQEITPDMYDKFRREVSRSTTVKIGGEEYTINQVIDMILRVDAWDQGNAEYADKFLSSIINIFNHVDINPDGFAALYQLQTNSNNLFRKELIAKPNSVQKLYSLIPQEFLRAFKKESDAILVFNKLYDFNPSIGITSVGRGEVALSFISDAIKGEKGDLAISTGKDSSVEIEIKGDGARLGGDGYAVHRSVDAINSILERAGSSLSNIQLKNLKNDLIAKLHEISQSTSNVRHLEIIKNLANAINHESTVEDIEREITQVSMLPNLKTFMKPLLAALNKIQTASSRKEAFSYNSAIQLFFSNIDQLSYEKFVDGVVSLRSYYLQENVSSILEAVKDLIPEATFKQFKDPNNYIPLVAALQLLCYLLKEKCEYIVFLNDREKHAICYQSQKGVSENLKAAYLFFLKNNFKFGLSVDATMKSIKVTFNG